MQIIHLKELSGISFLQKAGGEWLNQFFQFLNFFDTEYFYLILFLIVWIIFDWKIGARILCLLLLSAFLNDSLKQIFQQPRPFELDPNVAILVIDGFGFPSGGAQNALLFALVFTYHLKKTWGYVLAFVYVFLISLSRIYLGLHFFSDVLSGLLAGYLLFLIYIYLFPKIEKFLKKHSLLENLLLVQIIAFLMRFVNDSKQSSKIALSVSLFSLFLFLGLKFKFLPSNIKKFEKNKKLNHKRIALSLAGIFIIALVALFFGLDLIVSGIFLALWLVFGVGLFLKSQVKL